MPAMSYELLKANLVEWIPNEYNYCVLDIISSYYQFIFLKKFQLLKRIFVKLMKIIGIKNYNIFTPLQTKSLENINTNGYFIHYAGCHDWMK